MRLLAVVVLYHPGKDLTGNINSYLSQVDRLLLWDNTPGGGKEQLPLSGVTHPERLEYRGCGRNVGIGTALNDAVAYARAQPMKSEPFPPPFCSQPAARSRRGRSAAS